MIVNYLIASQTIEVTIPVGILRFILSGTYCLLELPLYKEYKAQINFNYKKIMP